MLCLLALSLAACGPSAEQIAARQVIEQRYAAAERAFDRRQDDAAFDAFAGLASDSAVDAPTRALARHRQGVLRIRQARPGEGAALLRSVAEFGVDERSALALLDVPTDDAPALYLEIAERFPDTGGAELAVERMADAPADPIAVEQALAALADRHAETTLGPVAALWRARVQWRALGDGPAARRTLARLTARWPDAFETDEALWMLAGLERRRGAWRRAAVAYAELADRHAGRGLIPFGSERAPRADDAALWHGRVLLHGVGDAIGAIDAFGDAIDDFGDGVTGDDARYQLALACFAADRPDDARAALRDLLAERPDSRHAERARTLLDGAEPPRPDPRTLRSSGARSESGA